MPPEEIVWLELGHDAPGLDLFDESDTSSSSPASRFRVPKKFLELARLLALHSDEQRWALLYRLLWRITHGERQLLEISIDPDVARAFDWHKSVRHDTHKMRAFVRFAKLSGRTAGGLWPGSSRSITSSIGSPRWRGRS